VSGYYKTSNDVGVFGRISFLIFIVVLGIESARQTVARLKKGRRVEELEQFALNDSMTGMYNRNAYDYFVKNEKDFEGYILIPCPVTILIVTLLKIIQVKGHYDIPFKILLIFQRSIWSQGRG